MRVQSFPLEIRTVRSAAAAPQPQNNNNNTVNTSEGTPVTAGAAPTTASSTASSTQGATNNSQESGGQGGSFNFNPNVEFFMEVTPEGITIDSLETTLVGSNQANDCKCCDCPC